MTSEEELDLVQKKTNELGEHFDSVQIFVTRHEQGQEGGTIHFSRSVGNWFTRYGQIRDWLVCEDESTRIKMRKNSEQE